MRVLISPQTFKGSLDAPMVAAAIERGIRRVDPAIQTILLPIADGGDGTVEALVSATQGELRETWVTGPLGRPVCAKWGILGDGYTGVIEMALASGMGLVKPAERNPLITTTFGTGELIKAALDGGCRKLLVGLGGSATNDGGAGAVQALGAKLRDVHGCELTWGGAALANLASIEQSTFDVRLRNVEVLILSDVTNPFVGREGASFVYGPQKGATAEMVAQLDRALDHLAGVIYEQMGVEIRDKTGAGAAGGLGGGLMAFLNARAVPGAQLIMEIIGLKERLVDIDLVITGEGQIDGQTAYGKAPLALAQEAKRHGLPVIALVGSIADGCETTYRDAIDAVLSITPRPIDLATAMADAEHLIEAAAERALRLFMAGYRSGQRETT